MRLIDADDLEKRFGYLATVGNDLVHKVTEEEKGVRTAFRLSKYETHVAPTIDTGSLRTHGKWYDKTPIIWHGISNIPVVQCSECEITFCDIINNHHYMYRYCPHCGARMDKEGNNDTE